MRPHWRIRGKEENTTLSLITWGKRRETREAFQTIWHACTLWSGQIQETRSPSSSCGAPYFRIWLHLSESIAAGKSKPRRRCRWTARSTRTHRQKMFQWAETSKPHYNEWQPVGGCEMCTIDNIMTENHHDVIKIRDELNLQARLHMPPNIEGRRRCIRMWENLR